MGPSMTTNDPPASPSERLKAAVARVCSPDSYYWLSRQADGLNLDEDHEVEVRVDIDPQGVPSFVAPSGWQIAHTKQDDGMVFLRRFQPLTDEALKAMFAEVLVLAIAHNGRFHSWMHTPELRDW
jgi:hypothetical protein